MGYLQNCSAEISIFMLQSRAHLITEETNSSYTLLQDLRFSVRDIKLLLLGLGRINVIRGNNGSDCKCCSVSTLVTLKRVEKHKTVLGSTAMQTTMNAGISGCYKVILSL